MRGWDVSGRSAFVDVDTLSATPRCVSFRSTYDLGLISVIAWSKNLAYLRAGAHIPGEFCASVGSVSYV